MKKWIIGLFLLLLFSVMQPVLAQDTSYVKVEEKDWQQIQSYVQMSQETLRKTQTELETLQTDLTKSSQQVMTLQTSLNDTLSKLRREQNWNKVLIGTTVVSLGINILVIILLVR